MRKLIISKCVVLFWAALAILGTAVNAAFADTQLSSSQAFGLLGRAVSLQPTNRQIRMELVKLAYQLGEYRAAKFHLNYLLKTSKDTNELEHLRLWRNEVVDAEGLKFGLQVSFLASTNIERNSENTEFNTELGTAEIEDGGASSAGSGIRLGGFVSREFGRKNGSSLKFKLSANQNKYELSSLNRTDLQIDLSWHKFGLQKFSELGTSLQNLRYAKGSENDGYTKKSVFVRQTYFLNDRSHFDFKVELEHNEFDNTGALSGPSGQLSLEYKTLKSAPYSLSFGTEIKGSRPTLDYQRYHENSLFIGLSGELWTLGSFSIKTTYGTRSYGSNFPSLTFARKDDYASLQVSFASPKISFGKLIPRFTCTHINSRSNVAIYEYKATDCYLSVQRTF